MDKNAMILVIAMVLVVLCVGFAIYRNHQQKLRARQMSTRLGTGLGTGYERPIENLGQR
jgi:hypothetical protein